jgi:hypothetical protein
VTEANFHDLAEIHAAPGITIASRYAGKTVDRVASVKYYQGEFYYMVENLGRGRATRLDSTTLLFPSRLTGKMPSRGSMYVNTLSVGPGHFTNLACTKKQRRRKLLRA